MTLYSSPVTQSCYILRIHSYIVVYTHSYINIIPKMESGVIVSASRKQTYFSIYRKISKYLLPLTLSHLEYANVEKSLIIYLFWINCNTQTVITRLVKGNSTRRIKPTKGSIKSLKFYFIYVIQYITDSLSHIKDIIIYMHLSRIELRLRVFNLVPYTALI